MGLTDTFRRGGGFLNDVDATITGYEFTRTFPGGQAKAGRKKTSDFNPLYCVLSARVDGANADVTTTLFSGDADQWEISDDGQTITPGDDSVALGAKSELGKLLISMVENGWPDPDYTAGEPLTLDLEGVRVHFVQSVNEEKTKKLGKRKAQDGKEYNRTDLLVTRVYDGVAAPAKTAPVKSTGRAAARVTSSARVTTPARGSAAGKKGNGEAALDDFTTETLLALLAEADGELSVSQLGVKVTRHLLKDERRDAVRKRMRSEDFLTTENGWTFDQPNQTITLA